MERSNRRSFLKQSALTLGTFSIVPRYVLGGNGYIAPSEMLNHAVIGTGGMGMGHIDYVKDDPRDSLSRFAMWTRII